LLEPHGAVAWKGLKEYRTQFPADKSKGIALETAHPSKFRDEIKKILGINAETHYALEGIENESEEFVKMGNNYVELKSFVMEAHR
jgi:threonine synthase